MCLRFAPYRPRSRDSAFSLVEVVVAVGIFAIAVISILGLILPNTQAVADQLDDRVAQRLGQNIQLELQRYGFETLVGELDNEDRRAYLVATADGSRVLITGEDPFATWLPTYNNYRPSDASNHGAVTTPLAAENNLETEGTPGNPPGIAFRDRYFLVEIAWPAFPQYDQDRNPGVLPLTVRIVWPYKLPDGPANPTPGSKYNDYGALPWRVSPPDDHSVKLFNIALTP